jgi:uncharacterized membrane protein
MIKPILALHIAAGSLALASMIVPIVARKGGVIHRRSGWVFVSAMAAVSGSALLLSGARFLFDPRPAARDMGFFLMAVSFLTGNSVSAGVRVLRFKKRTTVHAHWWDTGLAAVLTVFSAALGAYGAWRGQVLFIAFALIGLANGGTTLRYWLRTPNGPMHWWFQHMGSMLAGCIAATTAFLVVNAGNVGVWPLAAWLSPSVVGGVGISVWTAYYRRRFSGRPAPSPTGISTAAPAGAPGTP